RLLTRGQLEELTADLVERTSQICGMTLDEAGLEKSEIEDVILVGGMTRMPLVQRAVTEFFEREPSKGVHPDEVVALGASIQGAALLDDEQDMVLLDVTPHTLGIMIHGGYFEELIPQNSAVPTSRSKIFTTVREDQTAVKILVLQGESQEADKNDLLGEFVLTGLRRGAAGSVEVEVAFEINADGIVSVSATDLETGKEQSITVTASSGLTPDELNAMVEDAKDFAVSRRADEATEGVRQEAETLIADIEKLFPDVEAVVAGSDFGRDAIEKAKSVVGRTRSAMEANDMKMLEEQLEALARTHRMFRGVVGRTD
ncbi:MAG: Hsp70 family protein, partial [Myxococcales bacterium]|nr:Hsp70 family protein [Myxococcales bacterium]